MNYFNHPAMCWETNENGIRMRARSLEMPNTKGPNGKSYCWRPIDISKPLRVKPTKKDRNNQRKRSRKEKRTERRSFAIAVT